MMFAMMICLSDFEADMGATLVAPGSHRFPLPQLDGGAGRAGQRDRLGACAADGPGGSALFWESRTWHGQGGSTSDKARVSIGSIWAQHFVKPQDFFPAIVHDDVYETLTDADKEVLGFRVVREFGGAIGPRSPGDRRSNLNVGTPTYRSWAKAGVNAPSPWTSRERRESRPSPGGNTVSIHGWRTRGSGGDWDGGRGGREPGLACQGAGDGVECGEAVVCC